jgi:hypothetical protein
MKIPAYPHIILAYRTQVGYLHTSLGPIRYSPAKVNKNNIQITTLSTINTIHFIQLSITYSTTKQKYSTGFVLPAKRQLNIQRLISKNPFLNNVLHRNLPPIQSHSLHYGLRQTYWTQNFHENASYNAYNDKGLDCNTKWTKGTSPYRALPPSSGHVRNYYPRFTSCIITHTINHKLQHVTQYPISDSRNSLKRCGNVYTPAVVKFKGTAAAFTCLTQSSNQTAIISLHITVWSL